MDQRNLILAIALSAIIMIGFQVFYVVPRQQELALQQEQLQADLGPDTPVPGRLPGDGPALDAIDGIDAQLQDREAVVGSGQRITIATPQLSGSLNLAGGRIDDLTLSAYREEIGADSPPVTLLSPTGAPDPYFAEFGWVDGNGAAYGNGETPWTAPAGATLTPETPVALTWESEDGLRFRRTVAIDEDFMFTIMQQVENTGDRAVSLFPFGRITRINTPDTLGFYILHEGPIGVLDGTLNEVDYDDLQDDSTVEENTVGGWIGITDKYWLTALVPDQDAPMTTRFTHRLRNGVDRYQADYLGGEQLLAPGQTATVINRVFAGAKKVRVLDRYEEELGIERFDMAIDFGWFFFLTKPLLQLLIIFGESIGNFGLAILALTVLIKALFFPLASKSYRSMSRMKALQPQMTELREKFGEDRQRLQQEMMAMYKREKVSPVSGCLPLVVQIPVFFALYKVLFVSIEMRHAPFFGWVQDLSATDPTNMFNLFGLIPWDPQISFLHIGAWPLLMGLTMFLQQKLNPAPPDPIQARIFLLMPIFFTFLLANFPAGLVIYWTWNNILSIAQQYTIMRQVGVGISGAKTT